MAYNKSLLLKTLLCWVFVLRLCAAFFVTYTMDSSLEQRASAAEERLAVLEEKLAALGLGEIEESDGDGANPPRFPSQNYHHNHHYTSQGNLGMSIMMHCSNGCRCVGGW